MHTRLSRVLFIALLAWVSGGVTGCSGIDQVHRCNDGIDNDFDGLVDSDDPGCGFNGDAEDPDPVQCNDGIDNDGDGLIDAEDPGCVTPQDRNEAQVPDPVCSDGIDNDEDGRIDYPSDPGCFLPLEDSEEDKCPERNNGMEVYDPGCPKCSNGKDDDGDGLVDYPTDPGCLSAAGLDEFDLNPNACGGDLIVDMFPNLGEAVGSVSITGYSSLQSPECGGVGQERVWAVQVPDPATLLISTASNTTTTDTIIYLRKDCTDSTTEIGCNDNANPFVETSQLLIDVPEPGVYYLIVDNAEEAASGGFRVKITSYTLTGARCDVAVPSCAPGQTCRSPDDIITETYCLPPRCSDGYDNDQDGFIDYPVDPGCRNATDITEGDDCPNGPKCPKCSNGVDDDFDGRVDFPQDSGGCDAASDDEETDECLPGILPKYLPKEGASGTTPSSGSNFRPKCHDSTSSAEEIYYFPVFQDMASLTFSTLGSPEDTVLSVRYEECGNSAAEIACNHLANSGESVTVTDARAGIYYVFVDGDYISSVDYTLEVSGELLGGAACDPASTQFTCATGYVCDPVGLTCVAAACNNGIDDDGDGLVDYGEDPGCTSPGTGTETDACPADPGCPACSNGVDDDNDGAIDGADLGCVAAGDLSEVNECIAGVNFAILPRAGASGSTPSSSTDSSHFTPGCHSSTTATERVYAFVVDRDVETLTFSTVGSTGDTVLSVRYDDCADAGAEVACKQVDGGGESITLENPSRGVYYVFVDGDNVSNINYTLKAIGAVAPGGSCDPADAAIGCGSGYACDPASLTCVTALCANGIDDDSDGRTDFPMDPGCTAANDHDEADTCPGAGCPQCGDGIDNDSDGAIDFGSDVGCKSASHTTESNNCIPNVAFRELVRSGVTGTTPASSVGSKFSPSCHGSTTSTEDVYAFPLFEDLATLSFSTVGSTGDTVLSVRYDQCGSAAAEVACNHVANAGESVTVDNPAQGMYYVFVDGDYTSNISYVLNVSGQRRAGAACDPADTVYGCESGYACDSVSNTCTPAVCNNGIDEDADGLIDYPNDPGCDTPSDGDELDDCPSGPMCPVCSNAMDDDADSLIDYPADFGCVAAADPDESLCPTERNGIEVLVAGTTTGTTAGLDDDFDPSCVSSSSKTAPDKAYYLAIPGRLSTLTVDTDGSKYDTAVVLRPAADCTAGELACDDDSSFGLWSRMSLRDVPAGSYLLMVDGFRSDSGEYTLHVKGTIAAGAKCSLDQISAGLFACGAGTSCVDMGSGYRCQ